MKAETAKAIVEEAIRGGFFTDPLPEGDELIEQAEYLLAEAHKAHGTPGMDFPEIEAIMRFGGWEPETSNGDLSSSVEKDSEQPGAVDDRSTSQVVREGSPQARSWTPRENLPVPEEIEGDPTPMPRDLSGLDDREIRRLSGEQNAFLARTTWLLSLAQQDLRNATHLRESEYRKAVLSFKHRADDRGEKMTMSQAEKEALAVETVMDWDDQLVQLENKVDSLKALREIYKGNIERLSREASMRQDEWMRAGGKR